MDNIQLLCTFTTKKNLEKTVLEITNNYEIAFDKIYVLQNENYIKELICTYNIYTEKVIYYDNVKNTILIHRKKHTNSLYTINAMNVIIKEMNNGVLDNQMVVPWNNYSNMLLTTDGETLKKLSTRIFKIISL